jgi:hypothetical protein
MQQHSVSFMLKPLCALLVLAAPVAFAQSCPVDNGNTVKNGTLPSCNASRTLYTIDGGSGVAGVDAYGLGSSINVSASPAFQVLNNGNHASHAISARDGGTVNLTAPTVAVTTSGQGFGLHAFHGGTINQSGGSLAITNNTLGSYAYAIRSDAGENANPYQLTIISIGGAGSILQTQSSASTSNSTLRAIRGGVINIGNEGSLTIDTQGPSARGLYVSGPHGQNNSTKRSAVPEIFQAVGQTTTITTAQADGIQVGKDGEFNDWGNVDGAGPGIVTALGRMAVTVETPAGTADDRTAALRIMGGDAGTPSRYNAGSASASGSLASLNGPSVFFAKGIGNVVDLHDYALSAGFNSNAPRGLIHAGANAQNASLTLRGNSTTSTTPPSYLIDATDATASLNVAVLDASQVTGMTRSNGSTINVTLSDGTAASNAIWTLKARSSSTPSTDTSTLTALTLNAGGTLNASGDASATSAAANSLGTRYTVAGDLTANGGQIALNAYLDAGNGTADAGGDVLKIDGNTSGSGKLGVSIANASAATDTTGDGILVLEVTGTSAAEFTLASPVIAAGRQYTLQRGTNSAATQKNWYLVSSPASTAVPAGSALTWLLTGMGVALLAATRRRFGWRASR